MITLLAMSLAGVNAQPPSRWAIDKDGGISWTVRAGDKAHDDHIEMSGRRVSLILGYAIKEGGALVVHRILVWPALRTIPNNTHGSLAHDFGFEFFPKITVDGQPIGDELPEEFILRGMLTIKSRTVSGVEVMRAIFPSTTKPAVIENCMLRNTTDRAVTVEIGQIDETHRTYRTDEEKGVYGEYVLTARVAGDGTYKLEPGESIEFSMMFSGRKATDPEITLDPKAEQQARRDYVQSLWDKLVFECPDPVLEREFAFAKVRAAESIFETKGGLMHAPGGGAYYAAIWANDQAEYANPFFPFLGDATGNESALNAYRLFARYTNPDYKAIPSSIIAEATDFWSCAGDRGDGAMVAYGAARFALASGDRKIAKEMWPLVEWCLEYCRRKTNSDGVVASDSDELEGRFPAGDANLCTSSLTYDALRSAAYLAKDLGKPQSMFDEYQLASRCAARGHREALWGECRGVRYVSLLRRQHGSARVDLHPAHDGHLRPRRRHHRCALLAPALDGRWAGDRSGQGDVLGPLDAVRPAWRVRGGRCRAGAGSSAELLPPKAARGARAVSGRGVSRGRPAASFGRERALLPRHHRGSVRNPTDRTAIVRHHATTAE